MTCGMDIPAKRACIESFCGEQRGILRVFSSISACAEIDALNQYPGAVAAIRLIGVWVPCSAEIRTQADWTLFAYLVLFFWIFAN